MLKSMQQVAGSNTIGASPFCRAQLLRPVYQQHSRHTPHRPSFVGGALQPRTRHQHICSATDSEQNSQGGNENDVRPEVSKTKLAGKGDDNEVPKLGLAGTIVTWALLVFLFGGSLFFTFSRSFLPDMQPLDINSPEIVSNF